jgi:hypothetical protein
LISESVTTVSPSFTHVVFGLTLQLTGYELLIPRADRAQLTSDPMLLAAGRTARRVSSCHRTAKHSSSQLISIPDSLPCPSRCPSSIPFLLTCHHSSSPTNDLHFLGPADSVRALVRHLARALLGKAVWPICYTQSETKLQHAQGYLVNEKEKKVPPSSLAPRTMLS